MPIKSDLDPWDEIKEGRADEAGANIYWLYCGVRTNDYKLIAATLKVIIKNEQWRCWRWIGQEFKCGSLRECLLRKPPKGVGADLVLLRRLVYDDKEALDKLDQALQNPPSLHLSNAVDNVHGKERPTGNSIETALRRLRADDRPIAKELHGRVLAGEISVNRAAILAGYRKAPISQSLCREMCRQVDELEDDCQQLHALIKKLRTPENSTIIDAFYEKFNVGPSVSENRRRR
jgi:hypothetical protein